MWSDCRPRFACHPLSPVLLLPLLCSSPLIIPCSCIPHISKPDVPVKSFAQLQAEISSAARFKVIEIAASRLVWQATIRVPEGTSIVLRSAPGSDALLDAQKAWRHFLVDPNATLTIVGLELVNGCTNGASGGAILNRGTLEMHNVSFGQNVASTHAPREQGCNLCGSGGAIFNSRGGEISIFGTSFVNNTAYRGGAIFNEGTLAVYDSTFIGNTAEDLGGAVFTLSNEASFFTHDAESTWSGRLTPPRFGTDSVEDVWTSKAKRTGAPSTLGVYEVIFSKSTRLSPTLAVWLTTTNAIISKLLTLGSYR